MKDEMEKHLSFIQRSSLLLLCVSVSLWLKSY
jgi:hypothetical protein